MCGIVGVAGARAGDIDRLRSMRDLLTHRGPDSAGEYVGDGCFLGVRRLRIIDLVTGDQPFQNEDGTVHAVFNGEIYNFQTLRADLLAGGHRFTSTGDTEVLVHLYEDHGADLVTRLEGMFAIAIWDERRRSLLLARDRLGKKPLLYAVPRPDLLVFGSEFAALLRHPEVGRDIDPEAIDLYLSFGYVPGPRTAFAAIRKLQPAHLLEWSAGALAPRRYWSPPAPGSARLDPTEACEELLRRARSAVRSRLIADVPLGAYLSGGVDSSLVVALMAQEAGRVRTFSIGFEETGYSELAHARRIAERYGTEHHELVVRPDVARLAPLLARHYGEPYADSSALPTYELARMTREHVTVALNGDGGDEVFCGYDRYRAMRMAQRLAWIPRGVRAPVLAGMAGVLPSAGGPRGRVRRVRRFLASAALPAARRYLGWIEFFSDAQKRELLEPAHAVSPGAAVALLEGAMPEHADPAVAANAADLALYLPDDLLAKVDIASMACSLEVRSPLLDRGVVELGVALPIDLKIRGGLGKWILKRAAEGLVPRENLYRPKMGFGIPLGEWLRGHLREMLEDTVLSTRALGRGWFRPAAVSALVEEHVAGRADHGSRLWALVMFELWYREVVDAAA